MKTAISFPGNDDDDNAVGEGEEEPLRFDALVPSMGWVPVQQVNPGQVSVLFDPSQTKLPVPSQTSPLYSRSFSLGSVPAPGQGVLVLDSGTWKRSVVHDSTVVRLCGDNGKLVEIGEIRPLFSQVMAMRGDGNCLYRAVSQQVYGTPNHHALCRQACYEYIKLERSYFEPFVKGQFDAYLQVLQRNGSWGDDPELEALGAIYQCNIQVYAANQLQLVKQYDGGGGGGKGRVVRLVFYAEGHYDVLSDGSSALRPPAPPLGRMELQAIEQCKIRQAGGVQQALLQSDLLGTEEAQLEECETLCAIQQTDEVNLESQLLAQALQDSLDEALLNQALEDSLYL
ncbi:hypothetical protein BASA81_000733 [Batrachochytrium salamandrivorans]|nr:hypothetical protein BASA81_000733 [Batrachochytrium salamandrivorans]